MYEVESDPYCYPGTTVLKNRLDLQDQAGLDAFEAEITAQRATEPFPDGNLDYAHYRAIHRHLFQDVYAWAGEIRTVRIAKDGNWFCYPEQIDRQMEALFADLQQNDCFRGSDAASFSKMAAHFLAELNAIHPFREGNGRTQLSFLALIAEFAGHPLDLERVDDAAILHAMITSFAGDEQALEQAIAKML